MKAATFALGLLLASAAVAVRAADFYMVDASSEQVVLLDPSSIGTSPDGDKTARIAMISDMDLWDDDRMEFDCSAARYKSLSSVAHLAGGDTLDRSSIDGMVGVWNEVKDHTTGSLLFDSVCRWSPSMLSGDHVFSAADFESALHNISSKLTEMQGGR